MKLEWNAYFPQIGKADTQQHVINIYTKIIYIHRITLSSKNKPRINYVYGNTRHANFWPLLPAWCLVPGAHCTHCATTHRVARIRVHSEMKRTCATFVCFVCATTTLRANQLKQKPRSPFQTHAQVRNIGSPQRGHIMHTSRAHISDSCVHLLAICSNAIYYITGLVEREREWFFYRRENGGN